MKKKTYKIIAIFLIIISMTITISGCFNYRDINKIVFITAMVIDIDKDGEIVIYTEALKPSRSGGAGGGKGERIIFKGKGKTLFEAIRDESLASSYRNNHTQNRAIIITQRAAEKGFDYFEDFLDRDQEILLRAYLFVFAGDPEKLIKLKLKQEEFIGVYLYNLVQIIGSASRAVKVTLNQYLTRRLIGSRTVPITLLKIREGAPEDTIEINGAAVIKDKKMVQVLTRGDSQGYNFLVNQVRSGTLEVTNPDQGDTYITLEILGSNTKTDIKLEGEKVKLKKEIKVRVSVGESQKSFVFTEENRAKVQQNAEKNIMVYTTRLFEQYKKSDIDIFHIKEDLDRLYPKNRIDDPIKVTDLEVTASVYIEGSSDKFNNR